MKKNFLQLFSLVVLAVIMSCNVGTGNDPKSVAKKFFEAMKATNFDEAQKYATKDSKMALQLAQLALTAAGANKDSIMAKVNKHKVEYGEPVVNGEDATVPVTIDGKGTVNFNLKKEEGAWKMAFDLSSLMKMGMNNKEGHAPSESEMKEAEKALENIHFDSIK